MNESPAERPCPDCAGHGRTRPDWDLCLPCAGFGRVWLDGGPLFGCTMVLKDRRVGEIVELGTGHRGRIMRKNAYGTDLVHLHLIDEWDDTEATTPTGFPSGVGVRSVAAGASRPHDKRGKRRSREDHFDPLQRKQAL